MSNTEDESTVDRLISEVRQYREKLDEVKGIIYRHGRDMEKLSLRGALELIIRDNKELKNEVKSLTKELKDIFDGRKY